MFEEILSSDDMLTTETCKVFRIDRLLGINMNVFELF